MPTMTLLKKRIASSASSSPSGTKKARISPSGSFSIPSSFDAAAPMPAPSQAQLLDALSKSTDSDVLFARLREVQRLKESLAACGVAAAQASLLPPDLRTQTSSGSRECIPVVHVPEGHQAHASVVTPPSVPSPGEVARRKAKQRVPSPGRLPQPPFRQVRSASAQAHDASKGAHDASKSTQSSGLSALETLASVSVLAPHAASSRAATEPPKPQASVQPPRRRSIHRDDEEFLRAALALRAEKHAAAQKQDVRRAYAEALRRARAQLEDARPLPKLAPPPAPRPASRATSVGSASSADACYVGERHPATGLRHGRGMMHYPNGSKYVGQFSQDKRHGFGKVWYPSPSPHVKHGGIYQGAWKENKKSGEGRMEYANGDVYEGSWAEDLPNGKGTLKMTNGESYTGGFVDRRKEGHGVYRYPNGVVYEGSFKDDAKHGEGVALFPDGRVERRVYCRDARLR